MPRITEKYLVHRRKQIVWEGDIPLFGGNRELAPNDHLVNTLARISRLLIDPTKGSVAAVTLIQLKDKTFQLLITKNTKTPFISCYTHLLEVLIKKAEIHESSDNSDKIKQLLTKYIVDRYVSKNLSKVESCFKKYISVTNSICESLIECGISVDYNYNVLLHRLKVSLTNLSNNFKSIITDSDVHHRDDTTLSLIRDTFNAAIECYNVVRQIMNEEGSSIPNDRIKSDVQKLYKLPLMELRFFRDITKLFTNELPQEIAKNVENIKYYYLNKEYSPIEAARDSSSVPKLLSFKPEKKPLHDPVHSEITALDAVRVLEGEVTAMAASKLFCVRCYGIVKQLEISKEARIQGSHSLTPKEYTIPLTVATMLPQERCSANPFYGVDNIHELENSFFKMDYKPFIEEADLSEDEETELPRAGIKRKAAAPLEDLESYGGAAAAPISEVEEISLEGSTTPSVSDELMGQAEIAGAPSPCCLNSSTGELDFSLFKL